jgi:phosphoribosylanthranilate isomerase
MTWVKICGITNLEDAQVAVEAGADAVGFVFHEKSPRKVDVETVRKIVAELPNRVDKVGVFVEQDAAEIREIVGGARLSAAQLHGPKAIRAVLSTAGTVQDAIGAGKFIMVLPSEKLAEGGFFLSEATQKKCFAILVDSGSAEVPGGTGKQFDWENARGFLQGLSLKTPVVVAGGLTPSNVSEALRVLQPFGVDVASGVEKRPAKKDSEKVRAFVNAVRQADRRAG